MNATAGTGSVTIGGDETLTTGAATFSGNVVPVSYTHLTLPTSDLV